MALLPAQQVQLKNQTQPEAQLMHVCLHCVWIVITQSVETFINNSKQEFSSKLNSLESFSFNTEFIIHFNGKIFSHIQPDKKASCKGSKQ